MNNLRRRAVPPAASAQLVAQAHPAGRWTIQLFGDVQARCGDVVVDLRKREKLSLLLARLLLEPGVEHRREDLALWLWPTDKPRKGRAPRDPEAWRLHLLTHDLSLLKSMLSLPELPAAQWIRGHRTVQILSGAVDTDVQKFEAAVARGDHALARTLAAPGLLRRFEDPWLQNQRERLHALLQNDDTDGVPLASSPAANAPPSRPLLLYPTPWIDRGADQERLGRLLITHRLVVVVGLVGCGKTRLCVQTCMSLVGFAPMLMVRLGHCTKADQLVDGITSALGLSLGVDAEGALQNVALRLAGQRALMLLDGFEGLVGQAEGLLEQLLLRCPTLTVLLTSSRPLKRRVQSTLRVLPLPVPRNGERVEEATLNPAVQLFVNSARLTRLGFSVTPGNVEQLIRACQLLDGLPKALELAAARSRRHSPKDIGEALAATLTSIAAKAVEGNRPPRQTSLNAALTWAWAELSVIERSTMRRLCVLDDAWTAAQAVALVHRAGTVRMLERLVQASLLFKVDRPGDAARLTMANGVRSFVLQRIKPRHVELMKRRHLFHFDFVIQESTRQAKAPQLADLPNFIRALGHALDAKEHAFAVRMSQGLGAHLAVRGASAEIIALFDRVVDEAPASTPGLSSFRSTLARLHFNAGRGAQAQRIAAASILLAQTAGDKALLAEAVYVLNHLKWLAQRDHAAALDGIRQALVLAREADQPLTEGRLLIFMGQVEATQGVDLASAGRRFEIGGRLLQRHGDPMGALQALPGRVTCLMKNKGLDRRFERALSLAQAGERRAAALGHVGVQLQLLNRQSECLFELDNMPAAVMSGQREVRLCRQHGAKYGLSFALWNQALPLTKWDKHEHAALLLGFSWRLWMEAYAPDGLADKYDVLEKEDVEYVRLVRRSVSARLTPARWRLLLEQGERMNEVDALRIGSGQ